MDALSGGNPQTEAVVSQQDLSGVSGVGVVVGGAVVVTGGRGVEQGGSRGGRGRWSRCAREVRALVDTWGSKEGGWMLGKISLVTGLSFNIRIHVFMILSRMEVVITYRAAWDTIVP